MNKRMENVTQTKQNIIDAFWELYREKRIEKITVKEITNKAGYNRGTFYEYFKDVYDVLDYIEQSVIPDIDELPPIKMKDMNIGMPIDVFLQIFEKNSKYYSVLLGDKGDPAFASKLKNYVKPLLKQILTDYHDIDSIEMDFILEYVLSGMIGIMSYWFKKDKVLSAKELMSIIHNLMEDGVLKYPKSDPS